MAEVEASAAPSPLSPARLLQLLCKPRQFFADFATLDRQPQVLIAAYAVGMSAVMDQIDRKIMQSELGSTPAGLASSLEWLLSSWLNYWLVIVFGGILGAALRWVIGGWWYRKRLQWSGAGDPAPRAATLTFVYQEFVVAGPAVVCALIQSLLHANYAEAWNGSNALSVLLLLLTFWSCWTSYAAATTVFPVSRGKARFWFLALPIVFYVLILGVVGALAAFFAR